MAHASPSERMPPKTVAADVYHKLKEDIINGVHPPGTHLVRRTLAKKYGVSVIPVMEACFRLENDGLVENSPLVGTHVINLTAQGLRDERIFREAIECEAARQFAKMASPVDREQLAEIAAFLDEVQERLRPEDPKLMRMFQRQHSEFHIMIARMSGARIIYEMMKKLWYRRLMMICDVNFELFPTGGDWHGQLVKALSSGDPDEAERVMRAHAAYKHDRASDSIRAVLSKERRELMEYLSLHDEEEDDDGAGDPFGDDADEG